MNQRIRFMNLSDRVFVILWFSTIGRNSWCLKGSFFVCNYRGSIPVMNENEILAQKDPLIW